MRETKIFNIAVFDLVATGLAAYGMHRYSKKSLVGIFMALMVFAVFVHAALGIPTALNAYLGINSWEAIARV